MVTRSSISAYNGHTQQSPHSQLTHVHCPKEIGRVEITCQHFCEIYDSPDTIGKFCYIQWNVHTHTKTPVLQFPLISICDQP